METTVLLVTTNLIHRITIMKEDPEIKIIFKIIDNNKIHQSMVINQDIHQTMVINQDIHQTMDNNQDIPQTMDNNQDKDSSKFAKTFPREIANLETDVISHMIPKIKLNNPIIIIMIKDSINQMDKILTKITTKTNNLINNKILTNLL